MKFIDEVIVLASSGPGGHGAAMFRREAHVPMGGPAGGDGGRGGHVIFEVDPGLNTLLQLRFSAIIKAKPGGNGGRMRRTGRSGEDRVIRVPPGTVIYDAGTGAELFDLAEPDARAVVLQGGRGGRGNCHFTTSSNRAPDSAEDGFPGETRTLRLELKLLADVGLLGFPNAGKSTLIRRLSAARPKVAAYPFTTLEPSLGVVQIPDTYDSFVMADIPGLIEGAADGAGLGLQFLRHVQRCRVLLHVLSLDPLENEVSGSIEDRFATINLELAKYSPQLSQRPQVILLSKRDIADPDELAAERAWFEERGHAVEVCSSVTGEGLRSVVFTLAAALAAEPATPEST